jgi:hypothetical protein
MGKELVYRQREMGLESAYQLAGQTMATNMLDADAQEGAQALRKSASLAGLDLRSAFVAGQAELRGWRCIAVLCFGPSI